MTGPQAVLSEAGVVAAFRRQDVARLGGRRDRMAKLLDNSAHLDDDAIPDFGERAVEADGMARPGEHLGDALAHEPPSIAIRSLIDHPAV